jgi:hypothetical protein
VDYQDGKPAIYKETELTCYMAMFDVNSGIGPCVFTESLIIPESCQPVMDGSATNE